MHSTVFLTLALATTTTHSTVKIKDRTVEVIPDDGLVPNLTAPWKATPYAKYDSSIPGFVMDKAGEYKLRVYVCTKSKTTCYVDDHQVEIK